MTENSTPTVQLESSHPTDALLINPALQTLVELGAVSLVDEFDMFHGRATDDKPWQVDQDHSREGSNNAYKTPSLYVSDFVSALAFVKAKYEDNALGMMTDAIFDYFRDQDPNLPRRVLQERRQKIFDDEAQKESRLNPNGKKADGAEPQERPADFVDEENPEALSDDELYSLRNCCVGFKDDMRAEDVEAVRKIIDGAYIGNISLHRIVSIATHGILVNEHFNLDDLDENSRALYMKATQNLIDDFEIMTKPEEESSSIQAVGKLVKQRFDSVYAESAWDARLSVEDINYIEDQTGADRKTVVDLVAIQNTKAMMMSRGINRVLELALGSGSDITIEYPRNREDVTVPIHADWAIGFFKSINAIGFKTVLNSITMGRRNLDTIALFNLPKITAADETIYMGETEN